jgi:hypothetical protein
MITELNKNRHEMSELGVLDDEMYENIFSVYMKDNHYVYNILKRVTLPPGAIDTEFFTYEVITAETPWTSISYRYYQTIKLWWVLCVLNNILNPVYNIRAGTVIKVLKPAYLQEVLNAILNETR